MGVNDTKIYLKIKSKSYLIIEKDTMKSQKTKTDVFYINKKY